VALPVDGQPYGGEIDFPVQNSLRAGGISFTRGRHIIYLVVAEPGESYTFGLRMPNLGLPRLNVLAFDRWPYDPAAKMQHLPVGPTLMSHQDYIEYQWHIGVSAQSPGNLLYLVVELEKPLKAAYHRFPLRAFMTHPPLDPLRSPARGVTYARGPGNLMLQERDNRVRVVQLAQAEPGWRLDKGRETPPEEGLIHNSRFNTGLSSWRIFPAVSDNEEFGVSVGEQGLRLWAREQSQHRGIEQIIRPQNDLSEPVRLILELQIERQTQRENFQTLDDFPLRLDIDCQPVGVGATEFIPQFSRVFSVVQSELNSPFHSKVVQVPQADWYRYEIGLLNQLPATCGVKRIRLSGGGYPEREVRIKQVQLLP